MARASTRQKFVKGQTAWIHAYQNYWRKAQVIEPDVTQKALGSTRDIHYVKVIYFDRDGEKLAGASWNVLNNRSQISDQAAYDLVLRGEEIVKLQGDVREAESWEKTHAAYLDQANHVIALVDLLKPSALRAEKLALHLRSTFILKDARTRKRHQVVDVTRQRRELGHKATEARGRLQALEVKPWS